ncbi:hypothetical protein Ctaglu_22650 [Clostridium tagluense]|uniref:Uncharacterized protein n=1 Tax=Clostridium tagluense TaxID=360422 RepID=A0A401UM84_9CLOT|nr:hypothetical protein Ctaglu_22650 [Clostridium tagluense]
MLRPQAFAILGHRMVDAFHYLKSYILINAYMIVNIALIELAMI